MYTTVEAVMLIVLFTFTPSKVTSWYASDSKGYLIIVFSSHLHTAKINKLKNTGITSLLQ